MPLNIVIEAIPIFIHIPRTGGTSFQAIMDREFNNRCVLVNHKTDWNSIPLGPAYYGHHRFGVGKRIPTDVYRYLTLLREPKQRIVSHARKLGDGSRTVKQLLADQPSVANLQTRMISGAFDEEVITEEHLAWAKSNLCGGITLFGVTERYSAFVRSIGWKEGERLNDVGWRAPTEDDIPDWAIDLDTQLYEFAERRAP